MQILFCQSALEPKKVDEAFFNEYESAKASGFVVLLFDYENLSIQKLKPAEKLEKVIYRGWMLKSNRYKKFYEDLLTKNYQLINNPVE